MPHNDVPFPKGYLSNLHLPYRMAGRLTPGWPQPAAFGQELGVTSGMVRVQPLDRICWSPSPHRTRDR